MYDTEIEAEDWRDSAAICGLIKFFKWGDIPYNDSEIFNDNPDEKERDVLRFSISDITEEKYLRFIEDEYKDDLPNTRIKSILKFKDEFTDDEIKEINGLLVSNSVMKKIFTKYKFDGTNKDLITEKLEKNKDDITKETFRNKLNLYRNYANPNLLFNEGGNICRLNGYYQDLPKKGKSLGYKFEMSTFVSRDKWYYDFIPFAFIGKFYSIFINDNYSIDELFNTNLKLKDALETEKGERKNINASREMFRLIAENSDFVDYDTEVIIKEVDKDYYQTLYIRKECINILKSISNYKIICLSIKITDDNYLDVQRVVTNSIVNLKLLNPLIIKLLKEDFSNTGIKGENNKYKKLINALININVLIKKQLNEGEDGKSMNIGIWKARESAEKVVSALIKSGHENKMRAYRTKLTSALVFKDYNRFCEILLNLSDYSGVNMDFAYDLFGNFEDNIERAYAFVNALTVVEKSEDKELNNKEEELV